VVVDFSSSGGFDFQDAQWAPLVAAIVAVWLVLIVARLVRRRVETRAPAPVDAAHRRDLPPTDAPRREPASLASVVRDVSLARDRKSLADALAVAVDGLFDPSQAMVFVAADDDAREFVLAATSGRRAPAWPVGARLTETTGRIGLVARRRVAMDEREFGAESQFVRDQVEATEPSAFMVEVAAPVVVGDAAALIVAVGGSALPYDVTRARLESLTTHAAALLRGLESSRRPETSAVSGSRGFAPAP
jgi:hypothetical protein